MYKRYFLLFLILAAANFLSAQTTTDSDNDGISDSDDACPYVKGTKANKGCPAEQQHGEEKSFVTAAALQSILNAVCDKKLSSFLASGVSERTGTLLPTNLPKTGKNNDYPVYYQTDGSGSYITLVTLSNSPTDNAAAAKYIVDMSEQLQEYKCLNNRTKQIEKSKEGDITVVKFDKDIVYGSYDYLEWMVHNYQVSATETFVVLAIKTIPYKVIEEATKKQAKEQGVYDKGFCEDILKLISESSNGFKNIKGGVKDNGHNLRKEYKAIFTHRNFTAASISEVENTDLLSGRGKYIVNQYEATLDIKKSAEDAEIDFYAIVKRLDACLDFDTRELANLEELESEGIGISYTMASKNSITIKLDLINVLDDEWVLILSILDKAAK
jgi:hypothetical protein